MASISVPHHNVERRPTGELRALQAFQGTLRADVSAAFNQHTHLPPILQQCAEAVQRYFDATLVRIWLLNNHRTALELHASAGLAVTSEDTHRSLSIDPSSEWMHVLDPQPLVTTPESEVMIEQKWAQAEAITSCSRIPLSIEGKVVGVMVICARRPLMGDTFDLLVSVGDIIDQGLTRKRTEGRLQRAKEELEKQNARLEALYRVGQIINSTLQPEVILDQLTDEAMRVTRASHGQVLVVQKEAGCFERRSLRGFSEEESARARSRPLPLDQGVNGTAYTSKKVVRSDDVQTTPNYFPLIQSTRTELVIPIVREGQVLGNLDLQSPEVGAFADVDLNYLNALTTQVAIALTNARVFGVMEQAKRDWEATFNAMHDAVVLIDREGRVVHSNKSFLEVLEEAVADASGLSLDELLRGMTCGEEVCPLVKSRTSARPARCIHEYAGRIFDVQTIPIRSGERGSSAHGARLIYVMRDITERRRAEEELRALAVRLEQSNRELQDFASVASHDLQEPLRKIQAFGDRLKAKHGTFLNEEGRDYLDRMQNAAGRMQSLINDLLMYSRVTTKAQPFVLIDLTRVVREVLSDLEVRIEQAGGQVDLNDLPKVIADPVQMRQLFQNLIGNALKYHRPGHSPTVKVYAERVGGSERRTAADGTESWQIMVEDNGIGFDEKYLDRIFTPFQRLHSRSEYEGTGMGLAVCRKIVERHSGTITARSTVGEGTTFIVVLPSKQPEGGIG